MATMPRDPRWDAVDVEDLTVPGLTRDIPIRIFRPIGASAPLPAVLYFFGGAYWMRSYETEDMLALCRRLAIEANAVVVEIDYALAPENPYPAALNEGMAVLRWMAGSGGASHGIDAERLAVGGISSGGGIAASLTLLARDCDGPDIRLQILEVAAVDASFSLTEHPSPEASDEEIAAIVELQDFYFPDGVRDGDVYAVPSRAENLTGLPPALIISAEYDAIRPAGEAYAVRLRDAGVPCVSVVYGGQVHFSPALPTISAGPRAWRAQIAEAVRGLHRDALNPL
ncbi:alpha/beta hydrolase [Microbacterium sp. RD1]|uniref:alpha/beta hydrolase n=1 Tax=Microbacterium sp. RD1 TaxID=3457313 RepID=UPI003FA5B80F